MLQHHTTKGFKNIRHFSPWYQRALKLVVTITVSYRKNAGFHDFSLPEWMIAALDPEAFRLGIARQAVVKTRLTEKLDQGKQG
ncbi:hypothetical protein [Endozoicomonas ascidiicola]|uniref:hypothetical protein n=1 Tax=Endozoicomonas ascidiicola TaxID=1698521 RepID=UPI0012F78E72|nr:hypothetical protein [Endozoicomonas ascidiicola]